MPVLPSWHEAEVFLVGLVVGVTLGIIFARAMLGLAMRHTRRRRFQGELVDLTDVVRRERRRA